MRHAVIVLAAVSCLNILVRAQSAEELVTKNIEAKGGIAKIKAIHSIRIKGKLVGDGGFTAATMQENDRPNQVRETFSLDGDIIYYYLDPDTFLEIRKEVQEFIRGSVRESVTEMGSYKPVSGVMYPFSISQGTKANPAAQTTTVETIEVNVPIDKADFDVPASLKQSPKAGAEKK